MIRQVDFKDAEEKDSCGEGGDTGILHSGESVTTFDMYSVIIWRCKQRKRYRVRKSVESGHEPSTPGANTCSIL